MLVHVHVLVLVHVLVHVHVHVLVHVLVHVHVLVLVLVCRGTGDAVAADTRQCDG
ncbi:MAG TPA: hypothetical protein VMZ53_33915 [Kofleriaceae bacterium]|nr:hypothetical protein [Kofleriaceae bacterium]